MTIVTELVVSIVGGVLTAVVLSIFARKPAPTPAAAPARQPRRRSGFFSGLLGFLRVLIAVTAGCAIAITGGRWMIETGMLSRGLPTRFGLLVGGTLVVWMMLGAFRRR